MVQRARRAVLHAAGVLGRRVPLRAHHDPRHLRLQPELQHQRRRRDLPGRRQPALHVHRAVRTSSATSTPCRTTGSSSGRTLVDGATGKAGKARKFDTALASAGGSQPLRPHLGDRGAGHAGSGCAPARGPQPAARLPAADADRSGRREAPGPAGAHRGAATRDGDQRRAARAARAVRDAYAAVVLHPGRGQAPWRQPAGPGGQHHRGRGAGRAWSGAARTRS